MKCFYHSSDLDGHCSGAIVKNKYHECEMIGINYGEEFPFNSIDPDETVFMVDFSLQPFSEMEKLSSLCELIWIDHHESAIKEYDKTTFCQKTKVMLEVGTGACELTYKFFYGSKNMPKSVHLLGRYDVWDHANNDALPFQFGIRQEKNTLPDNQTLWTSLFADIGCSKYINEGKTILSYVNSQNEKFCSAYAFETILNGFKAICTNKGFTNSQLFNSVWDKTKYDIMITFIRIKPPAEEWRVSLYTTKKEIDCSTIAKSFGGGGHKNAAGFQCAVLPFKI